MNAQQLKNAILQDLYSSKDGWNIKELKDVVADSCPISYGIVQQGNHVDGGVPVVRPVDLHTKYVGKVNLKCTSKDISNSYKRTVLNGNEVLLCVRGTTGIVALATEELKGCNVNRGIVPLYFGDDVDKLFIYYQLQAPFVQEIIEENTMGSALKQINIKDLRTLKLFVPPLAEQHRIVAKIEELLPKVEEYGKAQDALNKLNAELPERLKKSILQEAIEGRLVPQDPNDEPASVLLDKIRQEKAQLVKAGKLKKKDLIETPITEDEIPFEIPASWEWVRFSTYLDVRDGTHDSPKYYSEGIPFVTSKNLSDGKIDFSSCKFISIEDHKKFSTRSLVEDGDILFAMIGSIGNPVIVKKDREFSIKNVALFKRYAQHLVNEKYLYYYLSFIQYEFKKIASGGVQSFIGLSFFRDWLFPLPPLAEQHRIVAKIEELLQKIEGLKK